MQWVELNLNDVVSIEKQVDDVCRTCEALRQQVKEPARNDTPAMHRDVAAAMEKLQRDVHQQTLKMERFYLEHDLDPRAPRIEACRLKLKRSLHGFTSKSAAAAPREAATSSSAKPRDERPQESPSGGTAPRTVTLKIQMTNEEYAELRARREAAQHFLHRGDGRQSWETAGSAQRTSTIYQGMNTFHEVPYPSASTLTRSPRGPSNSRPQFVTTQKPEPLPPTPLINTGLPYRSANPEVVARTLRFGSVREERSGGKRAVDSRAPFRTISERTKAANVLLAAQPLGTLHH